MAVAFGSNEFIEYKQFPSFIKTTRFPCSYPHTLFATHHCLHIHNTIMIAKYLLSLILLAVTASAQQCQVAIGVATANTECHADILNEIKLYSQIVYRDECGLPTTTGGTRKLRGGQEERDLQSQTQCDNWQTMCYLGFGQYYCQAYYSCLRRDLQEEEHSEEDRTLTVTNGMVDPLNDPNWVACDMNFGQFISNVDDNFLSAYATEDIRQCWKHMWCRATGVARR